MLSFAFTLPLVIMMFLFTLVVDYHLVLRNKWCWPPPRVEGLPMMVVLSFIVVIWFGEVGGLSPHGWLLGGGGWWSGGGGHTQRVLTADVNVLLVLELRLLRVNFYLVGIFGGRLVILTMCMTFLFWAFRCFCWVGLWFTVRCMTSLIKASFVPFL